jgi:uncharacterized protein YecT (DUF1311 family)
MRSASPLVAALICVACATPAPAQGGHTNSAPLLQACLASASVQGREPCTCIGGISRPCFDEPGGETTVGSRDCLVGEQRLWQALADEYIQQLRADASASALGALDAHIAAHIGWRAARCRYASTHYINGSRSQVAATTCLRDATAFLAIDFYGRLHTN